MFVSETFGGWIPGRSVSTGSSRMVGLIVGCVAAASTVFAGIGTGGELSVVHLMHEESRVQHRAFDIQFTDIALERTPAQDLARIREVLKPAVSDLAVTLDVSRQSVYNWLNGETVAEDNATKLKDLAQAADVLDHAGITVNSALLKRKFVNGRTLLQVAQAGESARDAALQLVHIHKREVAQRERMATRFASRPKTTPSADFDLPSANDHA